MFADKNKSTELGRYSVEFNDHEDKQGEIKEEVKFSRIGSHCHQYMRCPKTVSHTGCHETSFHSFPGYLTNDRISGVTSTTANDWQN